MSSDLKSKQRCFGSDVHRLLLAAESGHKADILTYYSGHLGPRSLNQNQPPKDTKQVIWKLSQSQEETPNPLKLPQTKGPTYVREKKQKGFTAGSALVESEVSGSRKDLDTDYSPHANRRDLSLPKMGYSSSLQVHPGDFFHTKSKLPPISEKKNQLYSDQSQNEGLKNEDLPKTKENCGRPFIARPDPWAGKNLAKMHERKLQKALKKLSANSWPHRDCLAVFSDVFDDVCESSPVFGRILREIKTEYDLYINHMMASQSPPHNKTSQTSLEDLSNGGLREMEFENAETEVCRLEQEAREALEENKRIRHELNKVSAIVVPGDWNMMNTSLSELQDSGIAHSSQTKRLQVLQMWREIQQLEEEIKEKLVSTVTTTATERCIKVLNTDIIRLIALNDCLKTTNKTLEDKINMILNKDKLNKTVRRLLWDAIQCNLQTE